MVFLEFRLICHPVVQSQSPAFFQFHRRYITWLAILQLRYIVIRKAITANLFDSQLVIQYVSCFAAQFLIIYMIHHLLSEIFREQETGDCGSGRRWRTAVVRKRRRTAVAVRDGWLLRWSEVTDCGGSKRSRFLDLTVSCSMLCTSWFSSCFEDPKVIFCLVRISLPLWFTSVSNHIPIFKFYWSTSHLAKLCYVDFRKLTPTSWRTLFERVAKCLRCKCSQKLWVIPNVCENFVLLNESSAVFISPTSNNLESRCNSKFLSF